MTIAEDTSFPSAVVAVARSAADVVSLESLLHAAVSNATAANTSTANLIDENRFIIRIIP